MPVSGLKERIGTGQESEQYLLGPQNSRMAGYSGAGSPGMS